MRVVVQRVSQASVEVDSKIVGQIQHGWLVLFGVAKGDTTAQAKWLAEKCVGLRAFNDEAGKMNLSVTDVGGSMLIVSQFTLYGDCIRGRRPGFDQAESPTKANELYEYFCEQVRALGVNVEKGIFQADMKVSLINDGPVTFVIER